MNNNNNETYNGWANRETWVVNLHFGDFLHMDIQELYDNGAFDRVKDNERDFIYEVSGLIENHVLDTLDEALKGPAETFARDMVSERKVDYYGLASGIVSDLDK